MEKLIMDIEVSPNRAMVGFMNIDTKEVKQYQYDEGKKIAKHIQGATLIGFNSLNYDNIILTKMLNNAKMKDIYATSIDIVENDGKRWDYQNDVESTIDLIEVAQGQASLKLYGARLGSKQLADLPYSPHKKLSKKQWKEVMVYNQVDLDVTLLLYNELIPQLKIREDIGSKYHINVMSRSDAQCAEDVFKKQLGITRKPKIDRPEVVAYEAPKYVKFKSKSLQELKKKFEETVYHINPKTGKFIAQEWLKEKIIIDDIDYTIGYGGLHSNEKSLAVVGDIKNADISSMYPSLIINSGKYPVQLGEDWCDLYRGFRDARMKIKHTDKELSAMLKIYLNGSYGKLNSVYSILYAPHLMLDTTITGQLSLLMVIEALTDAGIRVISANTDGVEYVDSTDKGEKIIEKLGKKMNLGWEYASYNALYARDVNNYIAVYDGYVKSKGAYTENSIAKNSVHPIVYEAIRKFLLAGTPMEETIRACNDVSQFCVSRAVTGGALYSPKTYKNSDEYNNYIAKKLKQNKALEKRNENYQKQFVLVEAEKYYVGKTVRFFYHTEGKPIYYKKSGNKVPMTDEYNGVKPMMELKNKIPKKLDYDAYIALANRYLNELGWEK